MGGTLHSIASSFHPIVGPALTTALTNDEY